MTRPNAKPLIGVDVKNLSFAYGQKKTPQQCCGE